MERAALVIMAKAPDAASVKTRLRGHLTDDERVALYTALLEGTVAKLRDIEGVDTYITYAPDEARAYFAGFGLPVFAQEGTGLGPRMHNALSRVLSKGYERAALVGADIPDLTPEVVRRALAALEANDCAFGPAGDGGYYLVALKRPEVGLFEGVVWSRPDTLAATLERARVLGMSAGLVDELHDLDTPDDLRRWRERS